MKRPAANADRGQKKSRLDEEIASDDELSQQEDSEEDAFFETADEKRVRLAKQYLTELGEGRTSEDIESQLQKDADIKAVKHQNQISSELTWEEPVFFKGHKLTPTCATISYDDKTVYTGGKDCAILKWDVETGKKVVYPGRRKEFDCGGHFDHVLGIAVTNDERIFVSVGNDRLVRLWDARIEPKTACVDKFRGHRGPITGVVIDPTSQQAYTCSHDKSIKIWNLTTRSYVDSLFGHTEGATCMDMAVKDRLISGGNDKTQRVWKLNADTHLLLQRHTAPVDCVAAVHTDRSLTGSQDGDIMAWSAASKRPFGHVRGAHGGNWISALSCVRFSDVAFSGSCDGAVKVWKMDPSAKKGTGLAQMGDIPISGHVNDLQVSHSGKLLVAAKGSEHKYGRWFNDKKETNGIYIVRLKHSAPTVL